MWCLTAQRGGHDAAECGDQQPDVRDDIYERADGDADRDGVRQCGGKQGRVLRWRGIEGNRDGESVHICLGVYEQRQWDA